MATQSRAAGEGEETGGPGAHAPAVNIGLGPTAPWRHARRALMQSLLDNRVRMLAWNLHPGIRQEPCH